MIKFEHTEVVGWKAAIRGMRNPKNSWDKSDSEYGCEIVPESYELCSECSCCDYENCTGIREFIIGKNDHDLMMRLRNAGTDHRKFMRMIVVYVDITAPLYWWKEFDTYKVGTVSNSCSTMHKIHAKEFTLEDFSTEHLGEQAKENLCNTIQTLNDYREWYKKTKDKYDWWQMIQLLPSSYNQKRTIMMNYEVLANMYKLGSRRNHKQDEWCEHKNQIPDSTYDNLYSKNNEPYFGLCDWIKTLPYSELITGEDDNE